MDFGDINWYEIKFKVKSIGTIEERLSYLYQVKMEINKLILCFEKPKDFPLPTYAEEHSLADDGCPQFKEFIKKSLKNYDLDPYATRMPTDDKLNVDIKNEVLRYLELSKMIEAEIDYYNKLKTSGYKTEDDYNKEQQKAQKVKKPKLKIIDDSVSKPPAKVFPINQNKEEAKLEIKSKKRVVSEKNKKDNVVPEKRSKKGVKPRKKMKNDIELHSGKEVIKSKKNIKEKQRAIDSISEQIDKEIKELTEKLKTETSETKKRIRERTLSVENEKEVKKITWRGTESELLILFDFLFKEGILSKEKYETRFAIIDKYFVQNDGEPFRTEDIAPKKNDSKNTWIKGYKRYADMIEQLKNKKPTNKNRVPKK
jgi:hypothetical protein